MPIFILGVDLTRVLNEGLPDLAYGFMVKGIIDYLEHCKHKYHESKHWKSVDQDIIVCLRFRYKGRNNPNDQE